MQIDIKDIVVLEDDKEYGVTGKIVHKNKKYFQLVDIKNIKNIMYCYQEDDELIEIEDKELIEILMPLFLKSLNDKLSN